MYKYPDPGRGREITAERRRKSNREIRIKAISRGEDGRPQSNSKTPSCMSVGVIKSQRAVESKNNPPSNMYSVATESIKIPKKTITRPVSIKRAWRPDKKINLTKINRLGATIRITNKNPNFLYRANPYFITYTTFALILCWGNSSRWGGITTIIISLDQSLYRGQGESPILCPKWERSTQNTNIGLKTHPSLAHRRHTIYPKI